MLKAYRLLLDVSVSSFLNRTVYYLRRLPLVGRAIPESLYGSLEWKRAIAWLVLIAQLLWAVLNKGIYLGLMAFMPAMAINERNPELHSLELFLAILLPLSFLTASIWNARVLEPKRDKYVAVKLLRISATAYMKVTLTMRYTLFFLSFAIMLSFFMAVLGGTVIEGVLVAAVITGWRLLAELTHLVVFEHTGKIIIRSTLLVWSSIFAGGALAYGLPLLGVSPAYGRILLFLPLVLLVIASGIAAALLLARYKRYPEAVESATKRDDPLLNLGQYMADSRKAEVAMKTDDLTEEESLRTDGAALPRADSDGYDYLNRLFFRRHRRLVRKPLWNRLAISVSVSAIAVLALALIGDGVTLTELARFVPYFAFSVFVGEKLCRALFYNCDMPLMRYGFYRQAAQKHYVLRLARLSGMNLLLSVAVGAVLTIAATFTGSLPDTSELIALWILLLAMALLISVHHMTLYYLLQPYTTEMNARNPLFLIVNMMLSAVCAVAFVISPPIATLAIIALTLLLLYLVIALLLVSRFGAVTFRIK